MKILFLYFHIDLEVANRFNVDRFLGFSVYRDMYKEKRICSFVINLTKRTIKIIEIEDVPKFSISIILI